ncbi:MAG: hypothetical protein KF691_13185 [Phycisphaeraceae bacterium]|nr:hypothetical protein [Phycisphaeraceae bacterium]
MNERSNSSEAEFIGPDPARDAQSQADELFVHGALGALHERAENAAERRMDRLAGALRRSEMPSGRRLNWARIRRFSGVLAVVLATLLTAWIFSSAATNQARATLMASIQAARNAGDRRYEVHILSADETEMPEQAEAVFDSSGSNFLLRARAPNGHTAIAGKDSIGEWAIRREGGIERRDPRRAWPRWATAEGESIFAESIEQLLEALASGYELRALEPEIVDGRSFRRIEGTKRAGASRPLADRIELWIDAETMIAEKMEMDWTDHPGPRGPAGRRPPPSEGEGPRGEKPDRPPPGMPPAGMPPPRGERPPPPEAGPGMRPPPPGAQMPGAQTRGAVPRRAGIRKLIITRVEAPEWPANWFAPEAHEDGSWGEP